MKIKHTFNTLPRNLSEMADWVICGNCNAEGIVTIGRDDCPNCGKESLAWMDEDNQELPINTEVYKTL